MANIYIYDITFLVLFTLGVIIFLYKRRSNLKRDGIMYLYRTKIGIKFIDYIGTKYKKTLRVISYLSVISGYLLMTGMIYFLYILLKIYLFNPKIVQQIPIFPLMPLVPYVPELFKISILPPFYFTYWIIAIAVIAICHEFAHGIIARRYDVKIKTTGFGFLGPFLAAFVEPDEAEMEKKSKFQQIAILSAGTFANVLLTIFFLIIFALFFIVAYQPAGVMVISPINPNVVVGSITLMGGINMSNATGQEILDLINQNKIKEDLTINCGENSSFNLVKITADNRGYIVPLKNLKTQLQDNKEEIELIYDLPAISQCLTKIAGNDSEVKIKGVIIHEVDGGKIKNKEDIGIILQKHKIGDTIKITYTNDNGTFNKDLILGKSLLDGKKAAIGVAYPQLPRPRSFLSFIFNIVNYLKDPVMVYEPKWNYDFTLFIYNLLWWLVLINFSVALINMWPVAIFDGGKAFMLTVWAITKSERFAKAAFKVVTYLILASIVLVVFGYFNAIYNLGLINF